MCTSSHSSAVFGDLSQFFMLPTSAGFARAGVLSKKKRLTALEGEILFDMEFCNTD